jgi:membrane protease YdiL (CAAX protease family)
VALLAFAFLFVSIVGQVIAAVIARAHGESLEKITYDARVVVPAQGVAYVAVFVLMYLLIARAQRPFWRGVQWNWPTAAGLVGSLLMLGMALTILMEYVQRWLPMPPTLPMNQFFRNPTSAYLIAVMAVGAAPLIEELFFRGFLYPVLRRFGAVLAVVATSLAFALVHGAQYGWAWPAVLVMFVIGLVLTITRARTGSVAASFLVHVGYNLMLFVLLFVTTDRFRHLERIG